MSRRAAGLTLIELLVIVGVVAACGALTILFLRSARTTDHGYFAGADLKRLTSHEAVWKQGDYDRNGQLDYWTRDVAGFHCVYDQSHKRLAIIDKGLATADVSPGAPYPEVAGGPTPKYGWFFQAMTIDQDGKPYVDASLPAPQAKNCPAGPCTNRERFGFVAYPNVYGSDGVLVFIVNEDGVIWQKDLGVGAPVLDRKAATPDGMGGGWSQYGG